jgi:ABC-2 type transport system permease protein
MVKLSMFILRLLQKPLQLMGADYEQLRIIIQTKLTIDFRRGPAMYQATGKSKQTFGRQLIMFVFLGIFISFGFINIHNLLLNYTIAYTIIIVMMATTLISEFTSVLFDDRDNQIILVRPVSNRTLLLSRMIHIQFYIMYIALALSVVTTIVSIFKFGILTAFLFLVGVCLSTWIALLVTTLFYLLVSKFVNGERFKDIITYFQIFLAMVVMVGYQFLPKIIEIDGLRNFTMTIHPWTFLIPPVWLASLVQLSFPGDANLSIVILALLAFIFTIVGGALTVRFLSGGFGALLSQSGGDNIPDTKELSLEKKRAGGIYKYLCTTEFEKSGWKLAMAVTRRDRKFKQAVYPSYGMIIIIAFAMMHPQFNDISGWLQELGTTKKYLMFIFFGFFATTSLAQLQYTDTPEAAWIYRVLPIQSPGHILSGAIKAMLVKFFIPMYVILTTVVTLIWGFDVLPQMFLGGILTVTSTLITLNLQNTSLPFTQAREMQQKGSNFLKVMLGMLIMGFIVGIVFLSTFLPVWCIWLLSALGIYINTFIYKEFRKTKFKFSDI